jgi:hypothetical protein
MRLDPGTEIAVPFGIDRWSPQSVRAMRGSRGKAQVEAPFPCILVHRGEGKPLRLYEAAVALFLRGKPASQDDPLASIRDQLKSLCDPWHRPAWEFVDEYLAAIEGFVARYAGAILAQSIGGGTLYEARDWIFSAPCPLPRAHLHAPAEGAEPDAQWVKVDFAFWNGGNFVAVDFSGARFLPRAAQERRARLLHAAVDLIEATPRDETSWEAFLARLLPPSRRAFWSGETIPMGPFPSAALDALDEIALG